MFTGREFHNFYVYIQDFEQLQASNNTGILNTWTRLWLTESEQVTPPRGFNKGRSSMFREGSWVRQTPEEGRRTYQPKRWGNNNKDKDNSPKTLNDKNHQASSQKFRQLRKDYIWMEDVKLLFSPQNLKHHN